MAIYDSGRLLAPPSSGDGPVPARLPPPFRLYGNTRSARSARLEHRTPPLAALGHGTPPLAANRAGNLPLADSGKWAGGIGYTAADICRRFLGPICVGDGS